ncbi:MAG: CbiX/SirB N-terminal domain-containing protein [Gammaproteobacteria bacterium]|nr:CbiX/SirB N-terminal domain-containing protein [Gammaproteobacteria bacterium]
MKSLLLVAHGSRRAESNDEVRELVSRLETNANGTFKRVACAFLELAQPSIPDGLRQAIHAGADEIIVVPYFLSAGRHVVTDIPGEVEVVRAEYPDVTIKLAAYLGAAAGIVELLAGLAEQV